VHALHRSEWGDFANRRYCLGKETDYNIFPDSISLKAAWSRRTDKHSVCGYLHFVDPENGDFRLKDGSIAFTTGFKNFTMDSFVLFLRC